MILSEGRLPQFSRGTAERESCEERPEHACTRSPDSPEWMMAAQSSHVEVPEANSTRPVAERYQTRYAAAAPVPVFRRLPVLPTPSSTKEPISSMDRPIGPKCQVSLRIAILAYHSLGDGLRDVLSV